MMEEDGFYGTCQNCGGNKFEPDNDDGYYYCTDCHTPSQDAIQTGVADEDFLPKSDTRIYFTKHTRRTVIKPDPVSVFHCDGNASVEINNEEFMNGPADFGLNLCDDVNDEARYKRSYNEVRLRYVMGVQVMVVMQCEALVERFGVNPFVCVYAEQIWLRYVAGSEVFDDGWADKAILESEDRKPGELPEDVERPTRFRDEFRNSHGERAVMIWYRSLRKKIPLWSSLAVSFLACHVARESILSMDIVKWTLEGKLPYLRAFTEIDKEFGHSSICPLSANFMFRPSEVVSMQKLEATAAQMADNIGLDLPPVNFQAIASRYLKQLLLPTLHAEKILDYADRVVVWSMPAELWLSVNERRLSTRVYVMAILIVSIRILYKIHGFGAWENSLSNDERSSASSLDAGGLLHHLEKAYRKLQNSYEYSKDLPTYLNHCKDVIFARSEVSKKDVEDILCEEFWEIYNNEQEWNDEDGRSFNNNGPKGKRSRDFEDSQDGYSCDSKRTASGPTVFSDNQSSHLYDQSEQSDDAYNNSPHTPEDPSLASKSEKDEAINRIKADMEENEFCYIPPRVNVKRHDYLHYVRKKDEGAYTYAAHADYYILLRACARIAQVDVRIMQLAVLNFERRLSWLEERIHLVLNVTSFGCSEAA